MRSGRTTLIYTQGEIILATYDDDGFHQIKLSETALANLAYDAVKIMSFMAQERVRER